MEREKRLNRTGPGLNADDYHFLPTVVLDADDSPRSLLHDHVSSLLGRDVERIGRCGVRSSMRGPLLSRSDSRRRSGPVAVSNERETVLAS